MPSDEANAAVNPTAICFDNPNNFNTPTVHLWNSNPANGITNTNWPGHNMAAEGNFYCYDPATNVTSVNLIFSDSGQNQTADMQMVSPANCWQNGQWRSLDDCGLLNTTQPQVSATSICYDNANQYNNPTIYMWNGEPNGAQADFNWPGQAMTANGYYYCFDPGVSLTSSSVIFNDNGNGQTGDLTYTANNACYSNGAWTSLAACGFEVIAGQNQAPVANAGADQVVTAGQLVQFDGSGSSDADGSISQYDWSNGLSGVTPSLVYDTAGTYTITLTVVDDQQASSQDSMTLTVQPAPTYNYPAGKAIFYINDNAWNTPTAYIWNVQPQGVMANSQWPGEGMTDFGGFNAWYVDIANDATSGSVIFSNSGAGQSADLTFSGDLLCYNNGVWMTLTDCGIPQASVADAGGDRTVNVNTQIALTAAASNGATDNATWQSAAWSGTLQGASVVTPELTATGTYTVTLTLENGSQDSFTLTVVAASQALPERPQLAAPLNFPLSGSVSSGNYVYESAFPALDNSFSSPVMVTNDGINDLIYVVDKAGKLLVFPNRQDVTLAEVNTLLDISSEVRDYHEQGMLSVAFHPDFATNRFAYIYYIEGDNDNESDNGVFGDGVLERITLNDATNPTLAGARVEILRIPQPGPDHKGSMMQFHPATGEFYMSIGDGAYGDTAIEPTQPDPRTNNSSQETSNLRGSFIRLIMRETPNTQGLYYDIPSDNPFVNDANVRDEIWSYGHRNPWRFSFDTEAPYTLWETEIGQAGFEEVNIITPGGNYGWPICEGLNHRGNDGGDPNNTRSCSGDLIAPIGGYSHNTGSVSIIGGFVYRGTQLPGLNGRFIYGDYVSKKIWSATEGDTDVLVSDAFPSNISSFGTDMSGEQVFITTHGAEYGGLSTIYRMVDSDVQAAVIPAKLSATGLFAELSSQTAVHGVLEYDVNSDGWFDGLKARHFVAIPNASQIEFNADDVWNLPVGSVLVKHLDLPTSASQSRPYETSVLFKQDSGNWAAANYKWNVQGTDADLITQASDEVVSQFYNGAVSNIQRRIRSGAECTSCHLGTGSKEPLSIATDQLNGDFNYQGLVANQLDVFNQIGLFSSNIAAANSLAAMPDPEDNSADLNQRARAYLDTNCAHCHDGSLMDFNYTTPVNQMDIMNIQRSGVYRMLPFDHSVSLVHTYQTDDANRMPKGTVLTNPLADQLIADWINGQNATQTGMQVSIEQTTIVPNQQVNLSTVAIYDNGFESIPSGSVTWTSSDTSVLDITGTSASVTTTAGIAGTTTIWASVNGQVGSIDVTVVGAPTQPSQFNATGISSSEITLTWIDNAVDEQSYSLRRATSANGPFSPLVTLSANSDTFTDSGLDSNTSYYYELVAVGTNANAVAVLANATTQDTGPIDSLSIVSQIQPTLIANQTQQLVAVGVASGAEQGVTLGAGWSSSNDNVVSVSSTGLLTAGNTAGDAVITASYQGITANVTVSNLGAGQYVYFNAPSTWNNPTAYIWSDNNGDLAIHSAAWPGSAITMTANEYGGSWLRVALQADWANGNGDINIIFNDNGANQTADLTTNINAPAWYDNQWLAQAPHGNGVENGSQIQVGNGEVTLQGSENLSGKLFAQGTVVDIIAEPAATGLEFVGWEGSGVAYLVDPTQANTQLVVGDALSYTLLAVFDSVSDPYVVGRQFYQDQGCAGCHGSQGDSGTSLLDVANKYDLSGLAAYIESSMPMGNAAACTGDCATETASMIMAGAYLPPSNTCNANDLGDLIPQDRSYRLLSTLEYNNSIRDLLGLVNDVDVTSGRIPADIPVNGFKTNANTLFTNDYAKGYINAAEAAATMVNNIYNLTSGCSDITCFLNDFGKRAFRRPLTATEITDLTAVYNAHGDVGVLSAILSSPSMLYRSEVGESNGAGYYELTDYEVAAMLSYTYWATTPDANLMAKADAGELSTANQIATTVTSMLQDARAEKAFERFITGWLDLDKDIKTAALTDSLKADMKQETVEFVRRTVFGGGTYNELLTADHSYMTQQLASHYGLQWPGGSDWQRVDYTADNGNGERRGILGHAGILAIQSASEKTHPVKRGLFVRSNLMCQEFPPPPIGAVLKPQEDPSLTVRERFENAHLQEGCESCHQYIDGIGFGLENYNALGLFTTTEITDDGQVKPINSAGYIGSLFSAETFLSANEPVVPYQGLDELVQLIADSAHAKACYARQWYRYTRGQKEGSEDSCTVQVFGDVFKQDPNATMLDLMVQFTQTQNYTLRK
ncbi:starch-binding protein [Saccharobesus litoralis]|nr:starch-binding protein [Saccharobesus litoralis]